MSTVGGTSVFFGILGLISWVLVPIGVILVIVGLVRYFRPREDDPEIILQRRYARGEISRSEYEELLKDLHPKEH